jgi:hypothetical protein
MRARTPSPSSLTPIRSADLASAASKAARRRLRTEPSRSGAGTEETGAGSKALGCPGLAKYVRIRGYTVGTARWGWQRRLVRSEGEICLSLTVAWRARAGTDPNELLVEGCDPFRCIVSAEQVRVTRTSQARPTSWTHRSPTSRCVPGSTRSFEPTSTSSSMSLTDRRALKPRPPPRYALVGWSGPSRRPLSAQEERRRARGTR